MTLLEAIETRRTVRDFDARPVPDEVILRALAAGLKAPSHNHQKEWHFVLLTTPKAKKTFIRAEGRRGVVTEDTLKNISGYDPLAQKMYLEAIPKQNSMVEGAPAVLVMVFKPGAKLFDSKNVADMNSLAAVWCCIENILLSFVRDGVYCVTLVPQNTPAVKQALGIPDRLEIAAVIPFGYKAPGALVLPQKEVAAEERIHRDLW